MIKPTLEEAKTLAATGEYTIVPLLRAVFRFGHRHPGAFAAEGQKRALLHAGIGGKPGEIRALHLFGYDPRLVLTCTGGRATLRKRTAS